MDENEGFNLIDVSTENDSLIASVAGDISSSTLPPQSSAWRLTERCYGCGRCFPVCPYDKIMAITYIRDAAATAELLKRSDVDAVEIHTSGRKKTQKKACFRLWTFPVIVDGPFGVVSAAEFIGILVFSVYIIWTVSFYIVHNVAAASSQPTFEEKRGRPRPMMMTISTLATLVTRVLNLMMTVI